MRKQLIFTVLTLLLALPLAAQDPYPALGTKLEGYFTALAGENAAVQSEECDFLISSCQDSLVRQYVALKIYDHYLKSRIMGDDAVAVHVAEKWLLSGAVAMHSDLDLLNARVFAEFNRSSLIGEQAPVLQLFTPEGETVRVPAADAQEYRVLYFYDVECSSCKMESARLKQFLASNATALTVYAVYTGTDARAWEQFRSGFPGVTHLWDPEITSDWQRLYGVLQTPKMFLISPRGIITGRGLDTPSLKILLDQELGSEQYSYGEDAQMEQFAQLFAPFGDSLKVQDVMHVAAYLSTRTQGSQAAYKQLFGDFLYYLSSNKTEVYRDAAIPFVDKYIRVPEIWNTPDDQAKVVSLGEMVSQLAARTPVGSVVPDLTVRGTLRQAPGFLRRASKEGRFQLRKLKGNPGYVLFYTGGCEACREHLARVDALVGKQRGTKVLLVDMDALMTDYPQEAGLLLDSFDLSGLPFVLELDKKGVVQHRYVDFDKL